MVNSHFSVPKLGIVFGLVLSMVVSVLGSGVSKVNVYQNHIYSDYLLQILNQTFWRVDQSIT